MPEAVRTVPERLAVSDRPRISFVTFCASAAKEIAFSRDASEIFLSAIIETAPMIQASRIIARSLLGAAGESDLISRESLACKAWKKAVGRSLAVHTKPIKLVRDCLVVEVEDEVWRNNLWGFRKQILKNLDGVIGPDIVLDLEFRIMPPRREPQRATELSLRPEDEASGISDPGLRRNYRRARARETA